MNCSNTYDLFSVSKSKKSVIIAEDLNCTSKQIIIKYLLEPLAGWKVKMGTQILDFKNELIGFTDNTVIIAC